jgi:hypothetical protein
MGHPGGVENGAPIELLEIYRAQTPGPFVDPSGRVTGMPSIIQRASVGRKFSGRATLEETQCRELLLPNDFFRKHQ